MSNTVGRLLAAGNVAEVFEWGSRVVKLYRSPAAKQAAFREAANHAAVEAMGPPVPAVWGVQRIDARWGIVFDRVKHASLAERMREDPTAMPHYLETLAALQARIHAQPASQFSSLKLRLAANIARPNSLTNRESEFCSLVLLTCRKATGHGNFHPINVLGEVSRPFVIDWPDACRGDPAADLCRSYLLLRLHAADIAEPYLDAYCRISNVTWEKVFDWLPCVAASRLAEDIPDECDRLREMAAA